MLQQQSKEKQDESGQGTNKKPANQNFSSSAKIRIQKDLTELDLPNTIKLDFPDPDNIMEFKVAISPQDGYYKGGIFRFNCSINDEFPIEPPRFKCLQKIYHPNIDLEGGVCLNILREDWSPVLSMTTILLGLQFLFLEPNAIDPLNKEAAITLNKDNRAFMRNVATSMRGGYVGNVSFDYVLK